MSREFKFDHLRNPASIGDSTHVHAYRMDEQGDRSYKLAMQSRLSTDAAHRYFASAVKPKRALI